MLDPGRARTFRKRRERTDVRVNQYLPIMRRVCRRTHIMRRARERYAALCKKPSPIEIDPECRGEHLVRPPAARSAGDLTRNEIILGRMKNLCVERHAFRARERGDHLARKARHAIV